MANAKVATVSRTSIRSSLQQQQQQHGCDDVHSSSGSGSGSRAALLGLHMV
jgi:hypothetical protein